MEISQQIDEIEEKKILEITLISAQGLKIPPSAMMRRMYTYTIAYVDPTAKLRSHLDRIGGGNPTWNEKFIFRVSDDFINGDTSAVQFQIYAAGYISDYFIGTVRYLLSSSPISSIIGTPSFSALHIRRPSGRIHGVLNIAATVYDSSHFASLTGSSAICFRDLIGKSNKIDDLIGKSNKLYDLIGKSNKTDDLFSERRLSRCLSHGGSKKSEQSLSEAEESGDLSVEESVDFSDGTDSTTSSSSTTVVTAAFKDSNNGGRSEVQMAGKKEMKSDGGGGLSLCGLNLQRRDRSSPLDQNLPCREDLMIN